MKRCKIFSQSFINEDRISELHDVLLLQILSSITTKDVVATSVLSKRWRSLSKMMTDLKFRYFDKNDLERFSDNVCSCLLSNQAPVLQSFHLDLTFGYGSTMDIGVMLGIAFGLHVRELQLKVYSNEPFRFPTSLYNCGTLVTLKLGPCILLDVPFPAYLKSLRTLHLYRVSYKDEGSVVNLLSGCSSLENLEVRRVSGSDIKTFTVDVPSLQSLTLTTENEYFEDFYVYVITTPSLKYLKIIGLTEDDSCLIGNTPELVEANIIDVSSVIYDNILGSLTSVKRLSLKIASPLELIKFPTGRIFSQLVYLELHTYEPEWWNLFMLMLDTSPNLQVLKLISDWYKERDHVVYKRWSQPKYVHECLLNCLNTLVWKNYEGKIEDEREVARYILKNASRLETAIFSRTDIHPGKRLERLKELESVVKASNSCQVVFKEIDTILRL